MGRNKMTIEINGSKSSFLNKEVKIIHFEGKKSKPTDKKNI